MIKKLYEKRCQKYLDMLLSCRLRLCDVPARYRLGADYALSLHIAALRVARGISTERYKEDLELLRDELAELTDERVKEQLERLYDDGKGVLAWLEKKG